ncbi:heterokaryon incompatibility protein-domain-containing protein [Stachybotrys elegans]|uniref:Heterokaryon incompatibility protein-domain-containing protein n=1 Tax=Stachybotrys elegans TaxID=80388 RepID=A0A8K0WLG0_9HYPO|nr:heterokaryon incompatibility protein-domain-containing protein [Stachybotrys elegans]
MSRRIQLLTLYPGAPSDQLQGELKAVDIDGCNKYEAISYVWGETSGTEVIVCNGASVHITHSLHRALARMRRADAPRVLWADQICIDQDNNEEKSTQISLMDIIYRNARRVLVWLGEDEERIAIKAFTLITTLEKIFSDEKQRLEFDRRHSDGVHSLGISKYAWSSLRALTVLPWFTRAWVIQEIGTKAPAILFWGNTHIEWELLHSVCKTLTNYHHLRGHLDIKTAHIKYMYRRFIEPDRTTRHANRFSFFYELHRARHLKATDPRDRVFAMLGHYSIRNSENQHLRDLRSDYTKTVEQVYTDVTTRGLVGDSTLTTLASVQHRYLPSSSDFTAPGHISIPSWVPDWREYRSHILSEPTSPHRASRDLRPCLRVDMSNTLWIEGILVDTIAVCAEPFRPREFQVDRDSISKIWHDACGQSEFDMSVSYLSTSCKHGTKEGDHDRSAVFALLQTLSNACVAIAWQDQQPYESISKQQWLAHGAAYLASAVRDLPVSNEMLKLAEEGDTGKWTRAANGASSNRTFATTSSGYYVLGPGIIEPGDVVCVLKGGRCLFVCGHGAANICLLANVMYTGLCMER